MWEFRYSNLADIPDLWYAYLWKSGDEYCFVKAIHKQEGRDYNLVWIETLYDDDIDQMMRDDFDAHEERVNAVRNWETDDSYESWSSDITVTDYMDEGDYYGANDQVIEQLYDLQLWDDGDYASDWNGNYLNQNSTYTLDRNRAMSISRSIDTENTCNVDLLQDIMNYFHLNEMENFLDCEDIR